MHIVLNPPPFPGDENEELMCEKCGAKYTMAEYRRFAWVQHSSLCVKCGSDRVHDLIRQLVKEAENAK